VTLSCSLPEGFTNVLADVTDNHSTDLFEPAFGVTKTGDAQAKVGDVVDYTITLSNTSGAGTPALTCTATDTLLGEVFSGVLPAGDTDGCSEPAGQHGDAVLLTAGRFHQRAG
jgi:uncharacterized repeat protein (TIGR01451 family)